MKSKLFQRGFTLIELAIVIVFIMILALFVFPTYANYVKRAKVTEGLTLAATAKLAVTHYVTENIPLTSVWTPPAPNDVVKNIDIHLTESTGISSASRAQNVVDLPARHPGEIVITFSSKVAPNAHNELILSPRRADPYRLSSNGHELPLDLTQHSPTLSITWECNSASPPAANLGTHGNLKANLAPADCRA